MDQLKQAVAAAFDNVVASGAIEAAIQEQIGKCVETAIRDQFSTYSDFTKAIKQKVATLVDVNLDQIELPSYRDLVGKVIRERVGAVMTTQFTEQLDKDIADLLSPAPTEVTLQQLLDDFIKQRMEKYDADDYRGRDFTLHIVHSEGMTPGYAHVYIDEDSGKSQYSCGIQLDITPDGRVFGLKLDGDDIKSKLFVGPLYNFERRLFQMYTAKTKLVIPPGATADDFSASYPEY